MNEFTIPLVVVGALAAFGYLRGKKKNAWIANWISRETEAALEPSRTDYINIGGAIGYNYIYDLKPPFREAKGTFTLLARQSFLYYPFSRLLARFDRYFLHLYTDEELAGEGHILEARHYEKARKEIVGVEDLGTETVTVPAGTFVLLFRGAGMGKRLKHTLEVLEGAENLLHFCCYDENRTFFCFLRPQKGRIEPFLASLLPELPAYFRKEARAQKS